MSAESLLKDKAILIVDDEPDVLETLEEELDVARVDKAQDYDTALQYLVSYTYDIVVLDIMGVDGYQLLKIATSGNIIAVMLTAYALTPEDIAKSFNEGAAFFLPKEKMTDIESYLINILDDIERGKNPWERWLNKLGAYCERHFGPDWMKEDKSLWEKFPFY